jgi:hypothetical protein
MTHASKLIGVLEQLDNFILTDSPAQAEIIIMTDDDARLAARQSASAVTTRTCRSHRRWQD